MNPQQGEGPVLGPYRVLDLTEGGCLIAGKILADLGADVIAVEPLNGNSSRRMGPFCEDAIGRQKSLFWFAYNANKRGIALDIRTPSGRRTLRSLVKTADLVIESFDPGYLDSVGLGYPDLVKLNQKVILTSITPFGQTGPKSSYKSCDLTSWASGGILYISGDPDRPPTGVSFPQAMFHGGAHAAAASLLALHHRRAMGEGQHVDVSVQECLVKTITNAHLVSEMTGEHIAREGCVWTTGKSAQGASLRMGFPCNDGFVATNLFGGGSEGVVSATRRMVKWMEDEGQAPQWLKDFDWVHDFDFNKLRREVVDRVEEQWARFLLTKTKAEICKQAIERRLLIAPANNTKDLLESPQLRARCFWQCVKHTELGKEVIYCGGFAKIDGAAMLIRRRPPLIGEHNQEVCAEAGHLEMEQSKPGQIPHDGARPASVPGLPLAGIKVIEFAWMATGPLMGAWLGYWGATVIKVESHTRLDHGRFNAPCKDGITGVDRSAYFANWNSCKYSVTLDLNKQKGRDLAYRLMEWADIVTESFRMGQMSKWGLGFDEISKNKPGIVYLSTNQMGQYGPYAEFAGYGHHASALSGITEISGWPDRNPTPPRGVYVDYIAPPFGLTAIMAALDRLARTGKGTYIDLAQVETALQFIAPVIMDYAVNGHISQRQGNRLPDASPHGVYKCMGEDRWISIAVFSDEEWSALCAAMGNPGWATDSKFAGLACRKQNEDELDIRLAKWTANLRREEVESLLQRGGVAAHVVLSCAELLTDSQLVHRGYFQKLEHPVIGTQSYERAPFKLSKSAGRLFRAPCAGEHNESVFKGILGLSDQDLSDLFSERVITTEADLPEEFT